MSAVTWTGSGGGDWDTAGDWSSNPALPGSLDTVGISTAAGATITHNQAQSDEIASLTLAGLDGLAISAGTLTIDGASTLAGAVSLTGGSLVLNGTTTLASLNQAGAAANSVAMLSGTGVVTVNGAAIIDGYDNETGPGTTDLKGSTVMQGTWGLSLDGGRILQNDGAFTLNATGNTVIHLGYDEFGVAVGGGTIDNTATGVFDIQGDGALIANGAGTNTFINAGTVKKSVGSGESDIGVTFNNTGAVQVQSGTLGVFGGGSSSGTLSVSADATLLFNSNYVVSGGTLSGAGSVDFNAGSVYFGAVAVNIGGDLAINTGRADFSDAATVGSLTQSGGLLSGPGTVTVNGAASLTATSQYIVQMGAGVTDLKGATTLSEANGYYLALDGGRVLQNDGVFALNGGPIYMGFHPLGSTQGDATIINSAGAVFDIQGDNFNIYTESGLDSFNNAGTLKKSAGGAVSAIQAVLSNTGTIEVDSGTLDLTGGGSSSGTLSVAAGATLQFNTNLVVSGGTLSGAGSVDFDTGSVYFGAVSVNIGGNLAINVGRADFTNAATVGSLTQSGGLLSGAGTVTVNGGASLTATSQYLLQTGLGVTDLKGATTLTEANGYYLALDGGRVLQNDGVFALNGGPIYMGFHPLGSTQGDATIINSAGAVFDIQGDNFNIYTESGLDSFNNAGTVMKSAGAAVSAIQAVLSNTGAIEVDSGTLELTGSGTSSGTLSVAAGASLDFRGAYSITGGSFTGAGTMTVATGDTLQFDGGAFTLGGGTISGSGAVSVSSGSLQGFGVVSTALTNNASIQASGGLLDLAGAVSGTGSESIANHATLELGGADAQAVTFEGASSILKLDHPDLFTGVIGGLVVGDAMDLVGFKVTGTPTLNGSTLTVTTNLGVLSYQVSGDLAGHVFTATDDGSGGSLLTLSASGIYGTAGNDSLTGTAGDDAIYGLAGNDTLSGVAGNDALYGGDGNDVLDGGAGNDTLDGGTGNNTASYADATAAVTVSLALQGSAQNTSGAGTDTLTNIQNLTGSNFNDVLTGDGGANSLSGGGGNDTLEGGAGDDTLDGGKGINTANYADAVGAVTVNLNLTTAQNTGSEGFDTLKSIQNLTGSAFDDSLTGNTLANLLIGGGGNDSLYGGAGNDTLDGGAGDDSLDGGTGVNTASYADATSGVNVSLMIAGPQNTLGAGTDTLVNIQNLTGSAYNDTLEGNAGNNTLDGGLGANTVSYANATAAVTVNLSLTAAQNTIGAGTDLLKSFTGVIGSAYGDTLIGSSKNDTIVGGAGDDTITGGKGLDILTGGSGADHFVFTSATDSSVKTPDLITDFSHAQGDKVDLSAISPSFALVAAFTHAADQLIELTTPGGFLIEGDVNGDGKPDFAVFVDGATPLGAGDFIL